MTKVEPYMVATLNYLIEARERALTAARHAQDTIEANLTQWAESKGLKSDEFRFSDSELAFVPVDKEGE